MTLLKVLGVGVGLCVIGHAYGMEQMPEISAAQPLGSFPVSLPSTEVMSSSSSVELVREGAVKRARSEYAPVKVLSIKQAKKNREEAIKAGVAAKEADEVLQNAKNSIVEHYTVDISDGVTGFEAEILPICVRMLALPPVEDSLAKKVIVWDIDETLLSNAVLAFEENFETQRGTDSNYTFRVNRRCVGIKHMVDVYKKLESQGYVNILVTSRRGWMPNLADATLANCLREGISTDKDRLFMFEQQYAEGEGKISPAAWKKLVREKLRSEGYTIVACVGDSDDDLAGSDEENVINFKLPNYLY